MYFEIYTHFSMFDWFAKLSHFCQIFTDEILTVAFPDRHYTQIILVLLH